MDEQEPEFKQEEEEELDWGEPEPASEPGLEPELPPDGQPAQEEKKPKRKRDPDHTVLISVLTAALITIGIAFLACVGLGVWYVLFRQ